MKSIICTTQEVRSILHGNMTQIRRVIKPQPTKAFSLGAVIDSTDSKLIDYFSWANDPSGGIMDHRKPSYRTGDVLWIREMWRLSDLRAGEFSATGVVEYKDGSKGPHLWNLRGIQTLNWRPSVHMPYTAARVFLRVLAVRCEHLQDITGVECAREGVEQEAMEVGEAFTKGIFHGIWDSINARREGGRFAWEMNPWVWVYQFVRVTKQEAEAI